MSKELMKQNIEKAQREIDSKKDIVKKGKMRQRYHFMAQTGWLNDPNGLIYFRGKYHFFFQHNPYNGFWDSMHWGHAVSDDMLHWEYLPLALAPSETYDNHLRGGCFSGSAIEHDGKLFLMFTGATNEGKGNEQTQCIAYSEDGIHFEKYAGNPVLTAPEGVPTDCFRDPKVWKHEDTYYMVCGASRDNKGQALLYRSKDMIHWTYFNVLAESRGEWGYMWECPDFYPMGDKYVLTFSPMGAGEHTSVYLVGDFDYLTGKFCCHVSGEIDWGLDYYAPQSFLAPDGRRIIVGWSNEWEWMPLWKDWGPTYKEGWCGFFNIPREVRMRKDGTLQFLPIREVETIRENPKRIAELAVSEEYTELEAGDGVCFELKLKIDLQRTNADELELDLRCGAERRTICLFHFKKGEMRVDRNAADGWSKGVSRSVLYLQGKKELDVHILSDQSSLEIFTDQYQNNHSNNIFAKASQNQLRVRARGGNAVLRDIETYGLRA
ncbi:glycoside hydrolase family 32 protein [Blautia hydrogenotrophica]|uniref:glycoside hydrolase family 32 protein n=1 Tax=Blautia hydrogenotrophica TaxID=53443 RepID=UPI002E787EB6|nr:glycoside hydrolase family 32 protein [Blautia hydrogenotrophica]MEE0463646.1 glycoside hydrolase family 32 protein [Blautia hydrogenotrophica]